MWEGHGDGELQNMISALPTQSSATNTFFTGYGIQSLQNTYMNLVYHTFFECKYMIMSQKGGVHAHACDWRVELRRYLDLELVCLNRVLQSNS